MHLSPDSNNSEWVRREISYAEQNHRRIFPVLIRGDEYDSIPLRLSSHQRVDLRRNFNTGLDGLARALKEHLGATAVHRIPKQKKSIQIDPATVRRIALISLLVLALTASYALRNLSQPTAVEATPPDRDPVDPVISETAADIVIDSTEPAGRIVYT